MILKNSLFSRDRRFRAARKSLRTDLFRIRTAGKSCHLEPLFAARGSVAITEQLLTPAHMADRVFGDDDHRPFAPFARERAKPVESLLKIRLYVFSKKEASRLIQRFAIYSDSI